MNLPQITIEQACSMVTDGTHYSPRDAGSGVPFLTVINMTDDGLDFTNCIHIDDFEFQKAIKNKAVPNIGDILFSKDGTVGKIHVVSESNSFAVLSSIAILRPNSAILDSHYFGYILQDRHVLEQATTKETGSALKRIILDNLKEVRIPLQPIEKQKWITTLLRKADRLRRLRRYALELSNTYLQSVFMEMFGDLRTNTTKYQMIPLGKICDVRDGTHESPSYIQQGYPLVTSKNLVNGYVDLTDVNFISEQDYIQINKRSKVDKGDILMPMIGTIGNPLIVDHIPNYAIKNVALIKFVPSSPSSTYIRELLRGYYFDFITSKSSRGGTQQFIALDDIRNFPIPLPSDEEQRKFNKIVKKFERLKSQQQEMERQAEHLFKTLLHRAFCGESL